MSQHVDTLNNLAENDFEVYKRTTCRLCNSDNLDLVLPMPATPVADGFYSDEKKHESSKLYDLDLYLCRNCGLAHLCDVVNPELIYRQYLYETTTSLGLVEHFNKYARDILDQNNLSKDNFVIEIGSNDGTLLRSFQAQGLRVLGVDPACDIAQRATQAGTETWPEFFTVDLSEKIKQEKGLADIVIANNVMANIDDLDSLMKGIRNILSPEGVFIFESGYLVDSVQNLVFDNVYHEHISYLSVKPLETFFKKHGMELIRVDRTPMKGGSIRGTVQLVGGVRPIEPSVENLINMEIKEGFCQPERYEELADTIDCEKEKLLELLKKLKAEGKVVAGYGASHSVTTFLYYFGIAEYLDFMIDDNPRKFNTFSPGHHIPVLTSEAIYEKKTDYVLILAWRYADPIMRKHQKYLSQGGRFIVPLPHIKVIENKEVVS